MFNYDQRTSGFVFSAVILLTGISLLLVSFAAQSAPRLPSPKRECSTCHIMWLREFKRKDLKTLIPYDPKPVVDTGKQDVVSTEAMCFSCHDGYVLDSRFLWKNRKHIHPVGVKPSLKVDIPLVEDKEIFPLNMDGKIYCGTCHSAHGVDWRQKESPIFLRVKNIDSSMCVLCHKNRSSRKTRGNHPLLKKPPSRPDNLIRHGAKFSKKGGVICQSCHVVHGSVEKKLLASSNQDSKLCTSCHDAKKSIRGTKHDLGLMLPDEKNIKGKNVAHSGLCSACHIPHDAIGPRLWARYRKSDTDTVSSMCLGCHNPKGPAHDKTPGTFSHPVNVPISRVGIRATVENWVSKFVSLPDLAPIQRLPLYNERGRRVNKGGNVTCLSCHDPHKWSQLTAAGEAADPREVEGDGNNSFLRIPYNGDNRLCTNCHRDKATVQLSKHNLAISAPDEENSLEQNVAQAGACSACHLPHNGEGAKMWAKEISRQWEGVERLCVSCHEEGGVAAKKQTGDYSHPVHVNLDRLPGEVKPGLPLFMWDASRDSRRGEVDCATCHDPHQWQAGKPASRSGADAEIEGDANTSFLRIPATHQAKLCLKCHKDKATLLGTDHDMSVTAPRITNAKGQSLKQSGVCGQCHTVHKAQMPQRLWARESGPGDEVMETMCRGCHQKDGIAAKKVPPKTSHPKRTVPANKGRLFGGRAGNINPPVFDKEGERAIAGLITCPTCHNPHRWDPASNKGGTGRNREGNAMTSFLRHQNTRYFLCSDCHGEDSLYRYKYFHWKKSRVKHHLYEP